MVYQVEVKLFLSLVAHHCGTSGRSSALFESGSSLLWYCIMYIIKMMYYSKGLAFFVAGTE